MWKEVPRTRKKKVLSSHHVESSRPSLTTVSLLQEVYGRLGRTCLLLVAQLQEVYGRCVTVNSSNASGKWRV